MCDHCGNRTYVLWVIRKLFHIDMIVCTACCHIFQSRGWKVVGRLAE